MLLTYHIADAVSQSRDGNGRASSAKTAMSLRVSSCQLTNAPPLSSLRDMKLKIEERTHQS